MITVVYGKQFIFGVPKTPLTLPGYEVVTSPNDFATARAGGIGYLIQDAGEEYHLWRIAEKNHFTTRQTDDPAVVVRKPEGAR